MRTILIQVDEHDALPDGCFMKFSALGPTRPIARVRCPFPSGDAACAVDGRDDDDRPVPAWTAPVDDSSSGQSWLVGGGTHGLRIRAPDGSITAEPYMLVSEDCLID